MTVECYVVPRGFIYFALTFCFTQVNAVKVHGTFQARNVESKSVMSNVSFRPRKWWIEWLEPRRFEPEVETLYRTRRNEAALPVSRALLLLASLGVLLFSAWDYEIDPTIVPRTLPVRFLCSAMSLVLWVAIPLPSFRKRLSWVFSINALAATLTIAWVLVVVPDGFLWGLSGFFYVPLSLLVLPKFRVVALTCALSLVIVNVVMYFDEATYRVIFNANFFLGFMCLMSGVLAFLNEVRDRRVFQLEQELEHLANCDSLSGAFNRRYFEETARAEIERARRYNHPLSLLMMDADHFKRINDTHGHAVGDRAIRAIVESSQGVFRTSDLLARMGGEEFAVLLPETDSDAAQQIAERVQEKLRRLEISTSTGTTQTPNFLTLTISIGVASLHISDTIETLLQRADVALYEAKHQGRNRVVIRAFQELT